MWIYEIGLKNWPYHDKTNFREREGQENNERWRIRWLVWRRPLHQLSSLSLNDTSLLPPHFNYCSVDPVPSICSTGRAPASFTVVKTISRFSWKMFSIVPQGSYYRLFSPPNKAFLASHVSKGAAIHLLNSSQSKEEENYRSAGCWYDVSVCKDNRWSTLI